MSRSRLTESIQLPSTTTSGSSTTRSAPTPSLSGLTSRTSRSRMLPGSAATARPSSRTLYNPDGAARPEVRGAGAAADQERDARDEPRRGAQRLPSPLRPPIHARGRSPWRWTDTRPENPRLVINFLLTHSRSDAESPDSIASGGPPRRGSIRGSLQHSRQCRGHFRILTRPVRHRRRAENSRSSRLSRSHGRRGAIRAPSVATVIPGSRALDRGRWMSMNRRATIPANARCAYWPRDLPGSR